MSPPKLRLVDPAAAVTEALRRVSAAGDDVEDVLAQAEAAVRDVFKRRHNELKPALDGLETAEAELRAVVEDNAGLFVKPRFRRAHGVQAQRRKAPDKWDFDADETAKLIAEHSPKLAGAVSTKTVIDTKALEALSPAQLKKIGVTRTRREETTIITRLRDDLGERLERVKPWLS